MEEVRSSDGTRIAIERSGDGPALVIVVGAFSDRNSKRSLAAGLENRYEVVQYDRRGRGDSGTADDWSIRLEVDDLAAVIGAAGGSAFVLGDSSGGALALEAAAVGLPIRAVAAYETPYVPGPSEQFAAELDGLLADGDRDAVAERFLGLFTPSPVIEQMKSGPYWAHMLAYAPTLPAEVRLCNDGTVPTERLAKITCPVLAMAGGASPEPMRAAAAAIAAAVPDGRSKLLENAGHGVADDVLVPVLDKFYGSQAQ